MSGWEQPISAAMARRLAEAADGFRSGKPVYLVVDYEDPERVRSFEGEGAREAAERARREGEAAGEGSRLGVFGPFLTEGDPPGAAGAEVLDVTIRVRLPDGSTRTETFGGTEVDALFWSRAAVDKFVVPYYAAARGLEHAARLADAFAGEDAYVLAHLPDSDTRLLRAEPPVTTTGRARRTPGPGAAA
ncbi:MAG TPA: hypothetical protein VHG51_21420 [Longimicrobiaceae bacterium]|nr:hypothetical protein [Longimicrobiaceae bacterium]